MKKLQEEYEAWLKANIPAHWLKKDSGYDLCAEMLMRCVGYDDDPDYEWSPNKEQYAWLADFCERWEKEEQA